LRSIKNFFSPLLQSLSAARPLISVYFEKGDATKSSVCLPAVFKAPIRPDIVSFIHHEVSKNRRQPYSVSQAAGTCIILAEPINFLNFCQWRSFLEAFIVFLIKS
jgi:hypothetical protein